MVIPGWRYLVSGGTTGQVFTKVSGADGDYQWSTPSSGGSPGGSDTQIQYNNAGAFGGVTGSAWSSSDFTFRSPSTGDQYCYITCDNYNFRAKYIDISNSANNVGLYTEPGYGEFASGTAFRLIAGSSTTASIIDIRGDTQTANIDCRGQIIIGDASSFANGSQFTMNDTDQKTTSNVKHEGSNASGTYFDVGANGTWQAGDVAAIGSSTKIIIDDSTTRIELNATKPVIGDTNGQFYVYNGNTSTYWRYKPNGSGVLTGTDTGSGSLP